MPQRWSDEFSAYEVEPEHDYRTCVTVPDGWYDTAISLSIVLNPMARSSQVLTIVRVTAQRSGYQPQSVPEIQVNTVSGVIDTVNLAADLPRMTGGK